jgi:hypothetical protein
MREATSEAGKALRDGPSARRSKFGQQACASSLLHFIGKLPHGFLRDHSAFTTREGGFRIIEREKKCRSLAFAFFPQSRARSIAFDYNTRTTPRRYDVHL